MAGKGGAHSYVMGTVLITIGAVGVVGSATGKLADMLAALFIPDILFNSTSGSAAPVSTPTGAVTSGILAGISPFTQAKKVLNLIGKI
jgi:hypothetical protein